MSDLHLEHWNVNQFCNRGFESLGEMNDGVINSINQYVKPNDTLYILGDTIWSSGDYSLLNRIYGKKILLMGNHDRDRNKYLKNGASFVFDEIKMLISKHMVTLSHYPYRYSGFKKLWNDLKSFFKRHRKRNFDSYPEDKGGWLIHGHHHSGEKVVEKQINVAWDIWKRPVNIQEIENIINQNTLTEN